MFCITVWEKYLPDMFILFLVQILISLYKFYPLKKWNFVLFNKWKNILSIILFSLTEWANLKEHIPNTEKNEKLWPPKYCFAQKSAFKTISCYGHFSIKTLICQAWIISAVIFYSQSPSNGRSLLGPKVVSFQVFYCSS